jgi:hypothetical protein
VNEKEILFLISRIVTQSESFPVAVERIGVLFERELGGQGLIVRERENSLTGAGSIATTAELFFQETAHLPSRSLYTVALRANGQELGRIVAFFACEETAEGMRQRLTNFAGEQLGTMLDRLRLAKRRRQLRTEIARIRTNLATRKALQRAEGILGRRGLERDSARVWLQHESARRGQSVVQVANGLFDQEGIRIEEPVAVRLIA